MKNWIQAARLRTLPLSVSGILIGSAYAYYQHQFDRTIFALAILTTLAFQVLSNFANDYGDGVKGTDVNRVGEKRLVASGEVSSTQMKQAVILMGIISFVLAVSLIYVAFGKENFLYSLLFLFLGVASIVSAIKYTVGTNAYGYSGFGDIFVFIFFGLVSVLGSNFLFTKLLDWKLVLPAVSIGLLSVAVLNLNNMRDLENDKSANKNTLVVKKGLLWSKKYHEIIIIVASLSFMIFCIILNVPLFSILIVNLPLLLHLKKIKTAQHYSDFEPELKKVALSTFALSVLFWLTLYISNF
ncbi:1,4-dihydroxy-2-naphthoate octaprenyltransferase [Flavobacterium sp.]|uniref:1,4-dihydroxy-2-naphthoate octaprenyltransferase n=1 Tax=Flavobacterium sp. TaxID=239 RepID=UPI0025BD3672|nr:1,4-dihydroxy-2-naphthoate octaprenyltransferase [Flavobacterium sp.]